MLYLVIPGSIQPLPSETEDPAEQHLSELGLLKLLGLLVLSGQECSVAPNKNAKPKKSKNRFSFFQVFPGKKTQQHITGALLKKKKPTVLAAEENISLFHRGFTCILAIFHKESIRFYPLAGCNVNTAAVKTAPKGH